MTRFMMGSTPALISASGGIRNQTQHCSLCHNPNANDAAVRPASAGPPQGISFPVPCE
jgi:hypothetical protein